MAKRKKTFLDNVLDKFGDDIQLKRYPDGHPTISTGSLAIDVSTGIGGIPLARYTEIYGPEQGGKTTMALSVLKEALKLGYKAVYLDVENSLDFNYLVDILGDIFDTCMENFQVLQPVSAEDAFKIAEMALDNAYGLVIFDSVGAISPQKELDDPVDKAHVGLAPRLMSQFLRKTAYKVRSMDTAFIFTNQVRANIGAYYGGYTTPAGYALKHYTSLRIYLSKGDAIKEGDDEIGNSSNFIIKKNKLALPYRTAKTSIVYGKGVDSIRDALKFGALLGVIKVRGPYYVFGEETLGQGQHNSIEFLKENTGTLDKIVEMCYNVSEVNYPPVRLKKGDDNEQNVENG